MTKSKIYVGHPTLSLEWKTDEYTTGSMDRIDEPEGEYDPEKAARHLYWTPDSMSMLGEYHTAKLVRSAWYITRRGSRTKHLEQSVVAEWPAAEFDKLKPPVSEMTIN